MFRRVLGFRHLLFPFRLLFLATLHVLDPYLFSLAVRHQCYPFLVNSLDRDRTCTPCGTGT